MNFFQVSIPYIETLSLLLTRYLCYKVTRNKLAARRSFVLYNLIISCRLACLPTYLRIRNETCSMIERLKRSLESVDNWKPRGSYSTKWASSRVLRRNIMRLIATQNSHSISEMNVVAPVPPSEHALGRSDLWTIFWYRCLHKPRLLRRTTVCHGGRGRLERRISHTISLFSKGYQPPRREIGGCPVVTIRVRHP